MHNVIAWPARVKPPAGPQWSVTDADRRRRQTTTDSRKQNNTAPTLCVGGPVTIMIKSIVSCLHSEAITIVLV